MTKTMLIDAAHPEEVRVCVLENGKVEDFDFESSSRKPLRGNIYLARVTRVEPSLQAAFVEYGGNRHGFLAFNEIHPDYYQIPVSDRRVLQDAEAEEAALAAELELEQHGDEAGDDDDLDLSDDHSFSDDEDAHDFGAQETSAETEEDDSADHPDSEDAEQEAEAADQPLEDDADAEESESRATAAMSSAGSEEIEEIPEAAAEPGEDEESLNAEEIESASDSEESAHDAGRPARPRRNGKRSDLLERYKEARRKRARLVRNYKIQEVIKRRQILLVQVVKEERGNKGAALTTYMSLAGRYCVLMPNTARGGGISRKIPLAADRKRLRRVVDSLDVPQGMGLIIRTAGAKRTKAEIKRDYDYLIRLWENIRALTLKSIAPCLIYEEASLIKRAIRDLYDKDIDRVLVEGDFGYREAKDFMKMLMPSHAKNVQPYKDKAPLFIKYGAESQLDAMYQPVVRLKSGGYLVIHQTEALVAIDVNSGKSTRERNIELTALKTNLEAAKEAARQFRLRDLAGLVVIDFIDMEENKNNRSVEKRLKDSLKSDRARIQVGRISNFGLLEMSRQRRRSGLVDGTTHSCPTCGGAGVVRSYEMAALRILRAIEGEAIAERTATISIKASLDVTLYILNHKRDWLKRIEDDYALSIEVIADETKAGDLYELEKRGAPRELPAPSAVVRADTQTIEADEADEAEASDEQHGDEEPVASSEDSSAEAEASGGRRRRRRRRRRRDEGSPQREASAGEETAEEDAEDTQSEERSTEASAEQAEGDAQRKRRRRGRRGGRRNRRPGNDGETTETSAASAEGGDETENREADTGIAAEAATSEAEESHPAPETEQPYVSFEKEPEAAQPQAANGHDVADVSERPGNSAAPASGAPERGPELQSDPDAPSSPDEGKSSRKGWWQRALGG